MNDDRHGSFRDAIFAYEKAALPELGATRTLHAVSLIEQVDQQLPADGLLAATRLEVEAAIEQVLNDDERAESAILLEPELIRFLDLAFKYGLTRRHPLSGEARIETTEPGSGLANREEMGAAISQMIANVLEEGLSSGLFLASMTTSLSDMGDRGGVLDHSAELLSRRWSSLTHRLRGPLHILRYTLPLLSLFLAVTSLAPFAGPLGSRTQAALVEGSVFRELKPFLFDMPGTIGDPKTIHSWDELTRRTGKSFPGAEASFEWKQLRYHMLRLEHRETGALVVVTPEHVGSTRSGTWRMLR